MHLSVGAPFLGAVQSVKGFMTGIGFSLPMEVADARLMGKTWSSGYWLLPHNVTSPTYHAKKYSRMLSHYSYP